MGIKAAAPAGTQRNIWIDILRLVFAAVIVLHHSRYVLGDDHCLFLGGSLAVEFFFYVSGYFLLRSAEQAAGRDCSTAPLSSEPAAAQQTAGNRRRGTACREGIGTETFHFILRKIRSFLPEFLIAWGIGFVFVCAAEHYSPREVPHAFLDDFWELTLVKMSGLFTHGIDGVIWYLSAMLLGMAVLYPLLRSHTDLMTHVVCPLIALFLYGYLCREEGHPRDPTVWMGFAYKGLLRGMAGLSVGVVIRMEVLRLKRKAPRGLTAAGSALVTAAEAVCLVLVIRYMALRTPSKYDYFYMFLMMILVLLCLSTFGAEHRAFYGKRPQRAGKKISRFCAKYSLALYLSHIYFAQHINSILPEDGCSGTVRMGVYLALSIANALLVMGFSSLWRRHAGEIRDRAAKLLIRK